MNAGGRLEAAIAKLEALKADSTPRWFATHREADDALPNGELCLVISHAWRAGDRALAVTLHGTIDAQIAVLRGALNSPGWANYDLAYDASAVALADAILGGAS